MEWDHAIVDSMEETLVEKNKEEFEECTVV